MEMLSDFEHGPGPAPRLLPIPALHRIDRGI